MIGINARLGQPALGDARDNGIAHRRRHEFVDVAAKDRDFLTSRDAIGCSETSAIKHGFHTALSWRFMPVS